MSARRHRKPKAKLSKAGEETENAAANIEIMAIGGENHESGEKLAVSKKAKIGENVGV